MWLVYLTYNYFYPLKFIDCKNNNCCLSFCCFATTTPPPFSFEKIKNKEVCVYSPISNPVELYPNTHTSTFFIEGDCSVIFQLGYVIKG